MVPILKEHCAVTAKRAKEAHNAEVREGQGVTEGKLSKQKPIRARNKFTYEVCISSVHGHLYRPPSLSSSLPFALYSYIRANNLLRGSLRVVIEHRYWIPRWRRPSYSTKIESAATVFDEKEYGPWRIPRPSTCAPGGFFSPVKFALNYEGESARAALIAYFGVDRYL